MSTEKELLERIHALEIQNSILQDKLDAIYAIVADADEETDEMEEQNTLVQIDLRPDLKK